MKGTGAIISVGVAGTRVTTGASAHTAIPNDSSGARAKLVRLFGVGLVYVRPSQNTGTITTADIPLAANQELLLNVAGYTHIGSVQSSAAEVFVITPVDTVG